MFGSTWGSNQQNQQQQQQPSAFGQPANTGFGAPGTFGQPQQQQQPQANPMFGGAATTGTSAFGGGSAFGATNTANATNPIFGAPKPATGFGSFGGGTVAFGGGGGAFGQTSTNPTASTSAFGQPSTTGTSAFGAATGTGLFGANKPATGFGATTTNTAAVSPVTTGSSNPPYSVTYDKDQSSPNVTLQYQAISCMPAYISSSHEELRLQDYAQGRKTAGQFGQSAAFGGTQQQQQQPATTNVFGAPAQQNPQPSAFGAAATPATTSAFGAFGQPAATNQTTAAPATGLFGGGSVFGAQPQQPQQQNQPAFGSFGQPQQQQQQQAQPATGSVFGGTAGGFGSTAAKPASAFGAFGGTGTATNAFGSGAAFGQAAQQPQQQPSSLFGQQQPSTTAASTNAFGMFGGNNANTGTKSLFGSTAPAPAQPAQSAFGANAFGTTQQPNAQGQQQAQPNSLFGGTGLFGPNNQQQQQGQQQGTQPNSLFGTTPTQNANAGTTNLFGGNSLFGGGGQQQQQQQQNQQQQAGQPSGFGSLFKPAANTTSTAFPSFGQQPANNTAPQQNSLFGSALGQNMNQQSTLGSSLFGGNRPAAPALGGSTSQIGGMFGGSNAASFTASTANNGAQGTMLASISQPIGASLPIFTMLPPGPRAVNLDQAPKKKAGFFVDVPTRSPVPRVQLGYTPANSKLRGFGSSQSTSNAGGNPFSSMSFTSGKPNALSLSRIDNKTPGPDGFLLRSASPSLGSGGRHSVKKLILDKKVEPSDLFNKSGGSPGSLRSSGKVTFSPALSVAVREKEAASASSATTRPTESPTPAPRPQRSPNRFTAQSTQNVIEANGPDQSGPAALEVGDYYVKPDMQTLKQAGYDQLSSFPDLIVGRVGYGEIQFLEPVDLTGLPKLGALLGEVIRFDDKECSVYPDSEDVDKPPPGSGLNVKARLSLTRCWAVDKSNREPVKDASHPIAVKHLKRLKNMKDTHFEAFDAPEGKWTFTVDHF